MNKYIRSFAILFFLLSINLLSFGNGVNASKKTIIQGSINLNSEYLVVISDLQRESSDDQVEISLNDKGQFQYEVDLKEAKWVRLTFIPIQRNRQLGATFPLYIQPNQKLNVDILYNGDAFLEVSDKLKAKENGALVDYAGFTNKKIKALYDKKRNQNIIEEDLNDFFYEKENLIKKYNIKDKAILNYLDIWAYNNYVSSFYTHVKDQKLADDTGEKSIKLFDQPIAYSFYNVPFNVTNYINSLVPTNEKKIARIEYKYVLLKEKLTNKELINRVLESELQRFVSSYKMVDISTYNQDIQQLTEFLKKIDNQELSIKISSQFLSLQNTLIGSSIPEVQFKDLEGNDVSLDQFKGKYIYIDLWASWCVPCIKEIPYLQALEKDFHDKNLVFVSISIDEKRDSWKNKVKELNLIGYQWEVGNSRFSKLMNVSGIPHFLLYGPDGKLIQYQAPRPSSPEIRALLENI